MQPSCPECGAPLSVEVREDEKTRNIIINLFCEGAGDDDYLLEINTHLCNDDLMDWDIPGSTYDATMKLIERTTNPNP
ncbi:MAG: hypothetical protein NTY03_02790 [Candidatus Bathyarchaeota archaeon]|nr:hypothetical protein [Candidatus Bathyarchaeota archaeon]